ncbi:hypothetical protein BKA82DRAFT_20442 [Pisolithus tinctorius]|uniref:Carbohydrate-binding module family 13 protein n=1 Tax=Pisolithus tinctorius Marx 270 TaxID=870435 RepID=A0A0C3KQS1_PISTI|nr:hypothetical protein BKA82DRAFT_20442 [Pisolithus tinctorius]KIO11837.1 carbohydrate-binding module family 13 protein [Pisolithus tinctorius Marx 270]
MPPSLSETQKWEIMPLGDGFMIRNVQTQKYLSVKTLFRTSPVVATSYPTAWHINRVYLPDENALLRSLRDLSSALIIRWPHSGYMFDLAGGESAPNTKVILCLLIYLSERLTDTIPIVISSFTSVMGQIQIMDQSLEPQSEHHRCRLWKTLFYCSASSTAYHHKAATTSRTNLNTHVSNAIYNATGMNGAARAPPHGTSPSHTLNTRAQQPTRGAPPGSAAGNERRNANIYNSTRPAPPPLTSSRSFGRAPYMAPYSMPVQSKAPMTGIGTVMGAARTQAPSPPSSHKSGGSASQRSSMGDSQRTSFTTPTGMHSSGPGTQDVGGQTSHWKEDGRHVATVGGKGGGGMKGFLARLTGGRADKTGKSKDF